MTRFMRGPWLLLLALLGAPASADRLVFGSFRSEANAAAWATRVEAELATPLHVEPVRRSDGDWYRVSSANLDEALLDGLRGDAEARGLGVWRVRDDAAHPQARSSRLEAVPAAAAAAREGTAPRHPADAHTDFDLGLQTRAYRSPGADGQDRFQPSVSGRFEYQRAWEGSRFAFTGFARYDTDDDERTHADVRELYWSRLGDDWEFHLGARQIFWGVTEFNHLVDIINQTDLVEDIDGEDKLGQPMAQLSLVRDWGMLDLFVMPYFRERTIAGEDGRLRGVPLVDTDDVRYAPGTGHWHLDGAVRWSQHAGPFNFGLYHFAGIGRDPHFQATFDDGALVLIPEYRTIDQTGLDGQAILGDWAFKLEAISRSGDGDRYGAFTAGFERTLVGVFGGRGDLGLVAEYMYDERDQAAYNTLFEHDIALGTRWLANDVAGTAALFGVIWDVQTDEYVVSLEASRRIGTSWLATLESRVFGGARLGDGSLVEALQSGELKSLALQDDDYVQLELTRYF